MDSPRLAHARLAALDFETTGVSRGDHRVVEIGVVYVEGLQVVDRFASLVNPGLPIHPGATAVHGITDDDVADAPRFLEFVAALRARLAGVDAIVCHNAPFDMPFLQREMKAGGLPLLDRPVVDTLAAARAAWGRGENSLGEVAGRLGIRAGTAHRALADAETTARVLIEFAAHFGEEYPLAGFPGYVADGSLYYRGDAHRGGGRPRLAGAATAAQVAELAARYAAAGLSGAGFGVGAPGAAGFAAAGFAASPDPAPSLIDPGLSLAAPGLPTSALPTAGLPGPSEVLAGPPAPNPAAALAAYQQPPARPAEAEPPQNQTVMRILLNSAVKRRREVTLVLAPTAPPARPGGGGPAVSRSGPLAAPPAPRPEAPAPRPLARRVEPRRVEEEGLVAFCPVAGAEEMFPFRRILEVRW